jgi:electron transfer flavoprotein beta subunit
MKAKRKTIDEVTPDQLGVDVKPRLKILKVSEPPGRKAGMIVGSVTELASHIKTSMGGF